MSTERIQRVRFLSMTGPLNYRFVFRSPKLSYTDNVFASAFHRKVWLSTLVIILMAAAVEVTINSVERRMTLVRDRHLRKVTFSEALLSMISIVGQQEALVNTRSLSSRTLNMMMLISLMFLYICFSANIVGLIQSPSSRIRSLDSLLNSGMILAANDDRINRIFMTNQSDPTRNAIYTKILEENNFISISDGSERIRQGLFAFHGETSDIYRYMLDNYREEEKCNLQTLDFLPKLDGYFSMAKDSPYLEHVKVGLLKLRERGFQQRELIAHSNHRPPCIGDSVFVPVSMIDALFAIELMAWSVGLAVVVFGAELAEQRYGFFGSIRRWLKCSARDALFMRSRNVYDN
ncbi:uncharacterized protein LOC129757150 [Uranotaenia lowii]|uniref:uncharacterized protein LOC129757150 n=1 Tax=Uranotaenia lowii TaxID=190385 RepID=UPI00247870DE|nr:uncharacterized protein LOC129757150 [Uranotaenia lowii]